MTYRSDPWDNTMPPAWAARLVVLVEELGNVVRLREQIAKQTNIVQHQMSTIAKQRRQIKQLQDQCEELERVIVTRLKGGT